MELQEVTWISRDPHRAPFHGVKQYIIENITRGYYQHVVVVDTSFDTDQVLSLPSEDIRPVKFDMPEVYDEVDMSIVKDALSRLLELKLDVDKSNIVWKSTIAETKFSDWSAPGGVNTLPVRVWVLEAMDVRNGFAVYATRDEMDFLTDAADIELLLGYTPLAINDLPMLLADYKTFRKLGDTWWVSNDHENYDDILDGMAYIREQGAQYIAKESQIVADDSKWSFIEFVNTWKISYTEIPSGYVVYPYDVNSKDYVDLGMPVLMWITTAYERFTVGLPPVFMRYVSHKDYEEFMQRYSEWYGAKSDRYPRGATGAVAVEDGKVTALVSLQDSADSGVSRKLNYALMDSGPDYVWFSAYSPSDLAELQALQPESPPERVDQTA